MIRFVRFVFGLSILLVVGFPALASDVVNPSPPVSYGAYYGGGLYPGFEITFDGSGSYDTDIDNLGHTPQWFWDFDHPSGTSFSADKITTSSLTTWEYSQPGTYRVSVRYKDNDGQQGQTYTFEITVKEIRRFYYLKDHLGSIRTTVDEDGNVSGYDDYYPFGLTMPGRSSNTGNPNDNYKYIGQELDDEAGLDLYSLNARTYDPVIARFLQIDPLFDHPNQRGLSPYNYSWNNPINLSDPSGLCPSCPDEEYAPLAEHIYSAKKGDVTDNGWKVERINETPETGFRGGVYSKTIDGKTEYIYATEGTTDIKDWSNNIDQVLNGSSLQYSESVGLARELVGDFEGISFTGHSLGGGLASANALAVEGKAVTFNAAGLTDATKGGLGLSGRTASISAYVVRGEILDFSQSAIGLRAEGSINMLPANYAPRLPGVGIDNVVRLGQRINNHGMSVVRKKMGN